MPIYLYVCKSCELEQEILHGMEESKRKCGACGALALTRKMPTRVSYHDTYSPMHPRRGRGNNGFGRVDPGEGLQEF